AIMIIGIGLLSVFNPTAVTNAIGFVLEGPAAFPEFVASYGGLLIAIGILMLAGIFKVGTTTTLLAMSVMYLGYVSGRIFGVVANGNLDRTSLIYGSFEISACVISFLLAHFHN